MFLFRRKIKGAYISHPLSAIPNDSENQVLGSIGLAIMIVGQYATAYPQYVDDMVSEAVLAIVEACDRETPISIRIHTRIARFIRQNDPLPITDHQPTYTSPTLDEIKEVIEKSIRTSQERLIIEMRAKSMVDREIAQIMDLSAARVAKIRNDVANRYEEISNDL